MAMLFMGLQIAGGIIGGVVTSESRQTDICKQTAGLQCKLANLNTQLSTMKQMQEEEIDQETKKLFTIQDDITQSNNDLQKTHDNWQNTLKKYELYLISVFLVVSLLFLAKRLNISLTNPFDVSDIKKQPRGSVLPFVVFIVLIGIGMFMKMRTVTSKQT